MMPNSPTIRILRDGDDDAPHWCGAFREGWSSIGRVRSLSLEEVIRFYFNVLKYEALNQPLAQVRRRADAAGKA